MDPERHQKVQRIFQGALAREPALRGQYLNAACEGDAELHHDVERLLEADGQAGSSVLAETATVSEQPDLSAGRVLAGRYQVEREIGHGGFGVVYLARDNHLHGKLVVVKVLKQRIESSEWFGKKFVQECEALARINHPGVVGVLDQGEGPDGMPFLVLQFVEGVPLRAIMRPGGMDLARTGKLMHQLGHALQAAHQLGVHHRDLKPENILVKNLGNGQEHAVIIDFGIATVKDSRYAGPPMTRIAGSFPYMAPEQLVGKPEAASDIYALGVIAYEMVTGTTPFEPGSPVAHYFEQKQGVQVKPGQLRGDLPEAAERTILKALSFEPSNRHPSPVEFAEELAASLCVPETPVHPPPRQVNHRRRWLAGVLSLVLTAVLAFFLWRQLMPRRLTSPVSERTLQYYMLVQKSERGNPVGAPFRLSGEMLFPAGYQIRLVLSSPQKGHLYLINEAPAAVDGHARYNILFPSPGAVSFLEGGKEVALPAPDRYFVFDEQQGEEKLWMIWSREAVAVLEPMLRWVNPRDKGTIRDSKEASAVENFLSSAHGVTTQGLKDEACKCTVLRSAGDVLVHLLKLEHH
jgi:serine/threonine protein kinase